VDVHGIGGEFPSGFFPSPSVLETSSGTSSRGLSGTSPQSFQLSRVCY
jgi:hypothetical protein